MDFVIGRSYKNVKGGYLIPRAKIPFTKAYLIEFHTSPASGVWRTSWEKVKESDLKKMLGLGRNDKLNIQQIII